MFLDTNYPPEAYEILQNLDGYAEVPDHVRSLDDLMDHEAELIGRPEHRDDELWLYYCEKEELIERVPWAGAFFYDLTTKGRLALKLRKAEVEAKHSRQTKPPARQPAPSRKLYAWVHRQRTKQHPLTWEEIRDELTRGLAARRGWDIPSTVKALGEGYRRWLKSQRKSQPKSQQ